MAKKAGNNLRRVECYHCGRALEVGQSTMSTSCPGCHKPVIVEDVVVRSYKAVTTIETCGKLIVGKRGVCVAARRIVAHGGMEVEGKVTCPSAVSAGRVALGPKSEWKGDLRAPVLEMKEGAKIASGYFEIPYNPLVNGAAT